MKRVSVIQFAMLFDTPAKKMITFVCPVGRFLKTVIQDGINTNRDLPVWGSFGKEHMAWNPLLNLSPHHSWWIRYLIVSYLHTYPPTNTWIQSFYKSMLMQAIFSVGEQWVITPTILSKMSKQRQAKTIDKAAEIHQNKWSISRSSWKSAVSFQQMCVCVCKKNICMYL